MNELPTPTPDPYFWYLVSGMLGTALLIVLSYFLSRLIAMLDRHDKEIIRIQIEQIRIKTHIKMNDDE
jgi:hypothetical protein